jgi:hypothetical protein
MLLREIIAVFCENHKKRTNTLCEQIEKFWYVKRVVRTVTIGFKKTVQTILNMALGLPEGRRDLRRPSKIWNEYVKSEQASLPTLHLEVKEMKFHSRTRFPSYTYVYSRSFHTHGHSTTPSNGCAHGHIIWLASTGDEFSCYRSIMLCGW